MNPYSEPLWGGALLFSWHFGRCLCSAAAAVRVGGGGGGNASSVHHLLIQNLPHICPYYHCPFTISTTMALKSQVHYWPGHVCFLCVMRSKYLELNQQRASRWKHLQMPKVFYAQCYRLLGQNCHLHYKPTASAVWYSLAKPFWYSKIIICGHITLVVARFSAKFYKWKEQSV